VDPEKSSTKIAIIYYSTAHVLTLSVVYFEKTNSHSCRRNLHLDSKTCTKIKHASRDKTKLPVPEKPLRNLELVPGMKVVELPPILGN
jgi:hypothetical protein